MRKLVTIAVACAAMTGVAASAGRASAASLPPATDAPTMEAPAAGKTPLNLDDLIKEAKKNGYEPSVVTETGGKIAGLKLTRLGKTEAGHGILQKKWDERDTIDLTLGAKPGGVTIESVARDVMVKPPIGDWIKQPSDQIPAWVLMPSMING
jgi:hypothetical protein